MTIQSLHNALKSLTANKIIDMQLDVFNDKDLINDIQTQLKDGIDGDGNLMPKYSPNTIIIKRDTGGFISKSGRIALKDHDSFYKGMKVRKAKGLKEVHSTDSKEAELLEHYGEQVVEITESNLQKQIDNTRNKLIKEIENLLT